jgi:hypothetical protein
MCGNRIVAKNLRDTNKPEVVLISKEEADQRAEKRKGKTKVKYPKWVLLEATIRGDCLIWCVG